MVGFHNGSCYHAVKKPDLRISIKDFRRQKTHPTKTEANSQIEMN